MRHTRLLVSVLACASIAGTSTIPNSELQTADAIIGAVGVHGAKNVNLAIYDTPEWGRLSLGLRAGNRDWILAALAIRPGGDGAAISDLTRLLTLALIASPEDVLEFFVSQTPPDLKMCRAWGEFAHNNYESAKFELDALIASIERVSDSALQESKQLCLNQLRQWDRILVEIYREIPK